MIAWLPLLTHSAEDLRDDRLHWALPVFLLLALVLVPLADSTSMGAPTRGVWALGLFAQWVLVVSASVVIGARTLGVPLADGSALLFLCRPISVARWAVIRAVVAWAMVGVMALGGAMAWAIAAGANGVGPLDGWFQAVLLAWVEGSVIVALGMACSVWVRPLFAGVFSCGLVVTGHLAPEATMAMSEAGSSPVLRAIPLLLPNLDWLDIHGQLLDHGPISVGEFGVRLAYGGLWTAGLLALTVWSLNRRDLA